MHGDCGFKCSGKEVVIGKVRFEELVLIVFMRLVLGGDLCLVYLLVYSTTLHFTSTSIFYHFTSNSISSSNI